MLVTSSSAAANDSKEDIKSDLESFVGALCSVLASELTFEPLCVLYSFAVSRHNSSLIHRAQPLLPKTTVPAIKATTASVSSRPPRKSNPLHANQTPFLYISTHIKPFCCISRSSLFVAPSTAKTTTNIMLPPKLNASLFIFRQVRAGARAEEEERKTGSLC